MERARAQLGRKRGVDRLLMQHFVVVVGDIQRQALGFSAHRWRDGPRIHRPHRQLLGPALQLQCVVAHHGNRHDQHEQRDLRPPGHLRASNVRRPAAIASASAAQMRC
ncbi:MAG: hypothetical protein ACRD3E_16625 [Terriglobales bacterium]